ncbi:MAG: hypothetical protein ABGX07_07775, partial [Pirellulaceae bacterium]
MTGGGKAGRKRGSRIWLPDEQNFSIPLSAIGPESEYLFEKEVGKVDDRLDPAVLPWSFEGAEGVGVLL